jgi:hypothetical protein
MSIYVKCLSAVTPGLCYCVTLLMSELHVFVYDTYVKLKRKILFKLQDVTFPNKKLFVQL